MYYHKIFTYVCVYAVNIVEYTEVHATFTNIVFSNF